MIEQITDKKITIKEIKEHICWDLTIKGAPDKQKACEEQIGENWIYFTLPGTSYAIVTFLIDVTYQTHVMVAY